MARILQSYIGDNILATGGVYTFNLFLGIVWIIVFNKIQVHEISLFQKLFYLIFTFFVGASTQNLAIALLTLIVLTFAIDFLSQSDTPQNGRRTAQRTHGAAGECDGLPQGRIEVRHAVAARPDAGGSAASAAQR